MRFSRVNVGSGSTMQTFDGDFALEAEGDEPNGWIVIGEGTSPGLGKQTPHTLVIPWHAVTSATLIDVVVRNPPLELFRETAYGPEALCTCQHAYSAHGGGVCEGENCWCNAFEPVV